jgi:tRNA-Thr(GGU) m(6)t(6)A37 methyltransferase TsaA
MPIQPSAAEGIKGHIVVDEDYVEGLCDLDGFSHIYLIYHLHLSKSYNLKVIPFLDDQQRGVFSTRAPKRPNPIGLSVVKLVKINLNILEIENVDIIDGTPLLDIKPYVQEMEGVNHYRIGWLSNYIKAMKSKNSDKRFE